MWLYLLNEATKILVCKSQLGLHWGIVKIYSSFFAGQSEADINFDVF